MCGSYKIRAAGAGAGAGAGALKEWIVHSNPFLEFLFGIEKCYFTFSFTFLSSWNIDKHGIVLQFRPGFCRLLRNWYFCLLVLSVLLIRSIQDTSPDQIHTASIHMPCSCCVAPHQLVTTVVCARAHIYIYICMLAQWLDYCTIFFKVKKNSFLQFSFKFLWGLTWYDSINLVSLKTI
jgi:hypothetical protein